MSRIIAIVGESGTGKSTSMRNLDPKQTVILSPIKKTLPFKGKYSLKNKNMFDGLDSTQLCQYMQNISQKNKAVNTIVIDDFQYVMGVEFIERAEETGYNKFTQIAQHAYDVIATAMVLRDDLNIYFLTHEERLEGSGKRKIKTIGKMLDEKITLEGLFTIVLFSGTDGEEYYLETQSDGFTTAKSPMGMFETQRIDNDLAEINKVLTKYYEEE